MEQAQVPLVPGYHGADQDPALLQREATALATRCSSRPALVAAAKACVPWTRAEDSPAALESCKREAINSFGDDAVLVENTCSAPPHRIQVFGDTHGNPPSCLSGDCSVQRRHQKVLEEALPRHDARAAPAWAKLPLLPPARELRGRGHGWSSRRAARRRAGRCSEAFCRHRVDFGVC